MGSTATSCKQANMDQTFSLLLFVSCQRPTGLGVYPPSPPPPPPPQYPTPAPVQDYNPDIGQAVGLRYAGLVVELVDIVKKDGEVVEIKVKTTSIEQAAKPKAFIHWGAAPVPVTVRMYGRPFKHKTPEDPAVVPGGFLEDIAEVLHWEGPGVRHHIRHRHHHEGDYQCCNVETPNCYMEEKTINDVTCTNTVEFNCKREKTTKNDGYGQKEVVCTRTPKQDCY